MSRVETQQGGVICKKKQTFTYLNKNQLAKAIFSSPIISKQNRELLG